MDTYINDSDINKLINKWNTIGLNIYLSVSVEELTFEIKEFFLKSDISLNDYESLVLLGNGGKCFGKNFTYPLDENTDPFDTFTEKAIDQRLKCLLLYPVPQYVPPLQKILRFFNFSHQSLMGMDISYEYGLWFGARALFLTKVKMPQNKLNLSHNICENCKDKDCISNCPGNAISINNIINLESCSNYRFSQNSNCADRCLARMCCPYKVEHQYELSQIQYHMTRFRHLEKLRKFKS